MDLELTAQRELLKYAVMRSIFNRDGSIADIRRSVLVQISFTDAPGGAMELMSGDDFDSNFAPKLPQMHEAAVVEVWDGRILNSRRKTASPGHYLITGRPATDQPALF